MSPAPPTLPVIRGVLLQTKVLDQHFCNPIVCVSGSLVTIEVAAAMTHPDRMRRPPGVTHLKDDHFRCTTFKKFFFCWKKWSFQPWAQLKSTSVKKTMYPEHKKDRNLCEHEQMDKVVYVFKMTTNIQIREKMYK